VTAVVPGRTQPPGGTRPAAPRALAARLAQPEVAAVVLAVLPVLAAIVHALRRDWIPVGDDALIEMRSRDVFTVDHFPWLGTWSSASLATGTDVNHPGPLLFDALAIPVRLAGGPAGVAIGVGAINAAAVVGVALAGRRLAGRAGLLWAAAIAAALSWTLGSTMLTDPWNPHVLILPFLLVLVLAAVVAAGELRAVPWLVGVASFCLQTHVGYAYVAPAVCVAALAGAAVVLRRRWRTDPATCPADVRAVVRTAAWTIGTSLVLWAQPLWEQVAGPGRGNLSRLASSAGGDEPTIGARLGLRILGAVVALPPWWSRSSFTTTVPNTRYDADGTGVSPEGLPGLGAAVLSLALVGGLLGALAWWSWRRRDRPATAALAMAAAAVVIAGGSLALMPIGVLGLTAHQMRWLWSIGAFVVLASALAVHRAVADSLAHRGTARALVWAPALALAAFVVANVPAHLQLAGPSAEPTAQPVARALASQLERFRPGGPVLFDASNLRFAEPYSTVAMSAMQRDGVDVRVELEGLVRQLGEARRADGSEVLRMRLLEGRAALEVPAGSERVAFSSPLTGAEIERLVAGERQVVELLRGVGLELTDAGRELVASGGIGVDPRELERAAAEPEALVGSGGFAALVVTGSVVVDPVSDELFRDVAALRLRVTTTTAALLVDPLPGRRDGG